MKPQDKFVLVLTKQEYTHEKSKSWIIGFLLGIILTSAIDFIVNHTTNAPW